MARSDGWTGRAAAWAATIAMTVVIASYAFLLPLGKWHPDEFFQIHAIQIDPWRALTDRIFAWSPRPVSEIVLWIYAVIVIDSGRPHLVLFLAALWIVLLLGLYVMARRTARFPALTATTLVAAFLLLEKPGEMFYWPAAAAAYLLCVGALGMACMLAAERPLRPWLLGAALVGAAWCSEIGAMTVLFDGVLLLLASAFAPRRTLLSRSWFAPMIAALFVVAITALHRGAMSKDVLLPGSSTIGSIRRSVEAALPNEFHELTTARLGSGVFGMVGALVAKLLLFLGFRPAATIHPDRRDAALRSILLGVALLLSGYGSLVLGYDKFGADCCERHETVRASLVVLALYSFAQAWPSRRSIAWRTGLLAAPLLVIFYLRVPELVSDYGLIGPTLADRAAVWRSGSQEGPAMEWRNAPVPQIADGAWFLDPGVYRRRSDTETDGLDWRYFAVMAFFGKQVLTVLPR